MNVWEHLYLYKATHFVTVSDHATLNWICYLFCFSFEYTPFHQNNQLLTVLYSGEMCNMFVNSFYPSCNLTGF